MADSANSQHPFNTVDWLIIGAGPVGLTTAALLHRENPRWRIVIVDKSPAPSAPTPASHKAQRHIALSHGSRLILEKSGLWPSNLAHPLHSVHVSQAGQFGQTLMTREALDVPALGYLLPYSQLVFQLSQALPAAIMRLYETAVSLPDAQKDDRVTLSLAGQITVAKTVLHCEGGVFSEQTAFRQRSDYQQTALLAVIKLGADLPPHQAWERFTPNGPIALLPLGGQYYSVVWCTKQAQADEIVNLADADKSAQLALWFGHRFAAQDVVWQTPFAAYALGAHWRDEAQYSNTLFLGNAAQTLHPVAGQGLNLGLRDAVNLVRLQRQVAVESPTFAAKFFELRKADRKRTRQVTDAMAQSFSQSSLVVHSMLGLGLTALEALPMAKQWVGSRLLWGLRK